MKNYLNLKVIILIFYFMLCGNLYSADKITPLPKPTIEVEAQILFEKKKYLLPKKKPEEKIDKLSTEAIDKTIIEESEELVKDTIKIYPKKKPLIYQRVTDKIAQKSKILSQGDFALAKKSFEAIKEKKWKKAIKISKKTKNKMVYKLVFWLYLKEERNEASFYDYVNFIKLNNHFPRLSRLRYLAEHKININSVSPNIIIKWFNEKKPLSGVGKIKLGQSYILTGNAEKGQKLIKEGWINARLSRSDMKYYRKKFKKYLSTSDYIMRADYLAWENKFWDLKRMLRYLPKDYRALYTARQLLMSKSYGVDAAIQKVPEKFKNDIGLKYDRLKWRRKRGRLDSSLEILLDIPNDSLKLVRPDKWWIERAIITRSLIYKKKYSLAYKIASNHSLKNGPEFAEAEWLSGWIALTFLEDSNLALQHFKTFYENVGYPISLSRGAYWIGKTYKVMKNKKLSEQWYGEASKYLTTYYGQLAFNELNNKGDFYLDEELNITDRFRDNFNQNILIKHVKLLKELNKTKYSKDIIKHLGKSNISEGSEILAGELAIEIGRYDYAIQIAKQASYQKRFHNKINYPIMKVPNIVNKKKMAAQELILAVIRQESEFDSEANSYAGAKGLMQLMTYTAKLVSKQAKLSYSKRRLTKDPTYNIKLGSYYLTGLLEEYEGSYPFALAAYNAGPKRVRYWKKINGNPQKGAIEYVDWIELIKFKETRNYVQRVLENVNVYKYLLKGKPIKIYNFFEDKPHY